MISVDDSRASISGHLIRGKGNILIVSDGIYKIVAKIVGFFDGPIFGQEVKRCICQPRSQNSTQLVQIFIKPGAEAKTFQFIRRCNCAVKTTRHNMP